jgi:hypothetical protein
LSAKCYGAKHLRIAIFVVLLVSIIFFNIIGLPSNITNRTFSKELIVRYGLTDKELEGKKLITKELIEQHGGVIGSDTFYAAYIKSDIYWYWPQNTKVMVIDDYILSGNFKDCPYGIIMLRDALYKEPFGFGNGSIYKLEYNPIERAKTQGYNEIWGNEEIHCLVRK